MRLVVTGGGTGGHVYPALEIARYARSQGEELLYLGSFRGQEGAACAREGVPFQGFAALPLYSLKTPRGWKSAVVLMRAVGTAKALLRIAKPDAVVSTGGYSAAPVISAARSLKIPYVLFEANSVPGRTHRMFAEQASGFASVFHKTAEVMKRIAVTRTGMPVRMALRDASKVAADLAIGGPSAAILVVGGSQGSAFLNEAVPKAARVLAANARPAETDDPWHPEPSSLAGSLRESAARSAHSIGFLHATGPKNFDAAVANPLPPGYRLVPYLEQEEMLRGLSSSRLAVARSGGTLAEFACFRLPSVLVPLPTSADDHQLHNAGEFEAMGAATVVEQKDATPERLAEAIRGWLDRDVAAAQKAMADWDVPDAVERIYQLIANSRSERH